MSIWKVTAAIVCGILFFTGGAAWAQASIPSDGKLKDGAVQPWYEQEAGREYLSAAVFPPHMSYVPLRGNSGGQALPVGQLRENTEGKMVSAWAAGLKLSDGEAAILKKFLSGEAVPRGAEQLQDRILRFTEAIREQGGENIPFNWASIKVSDFHRIQLLRHGNRYAQAASARIWLVSEGFVLPGFVKLYLFPRNGQFYILAVMSSDGERRFVEAASDKLVFSLTDSRTAEEDRVRAEEVVHVSKS